MMKAVSGEEGTSSTNYTRQVAAEPKQKNTETPNQNSTTEKENFEKADNVVDVRILTERDINEPRIESFGYVEFADEAGYQRGHDLNVSQLSNRKIKVVYTQGENKKSENQKSEIKSKNFKLHAMRKQGKCGDSRGPFKGGFKGRQKLNYFH
ncbi:hypothetical protein WA026_023571 [Henosepilachna vigintioctopunctata]|uniref:RRM domain-containing protein n=1 Tax=Henosepilachna vigintioctopunctata TaxID=420089 RepID=A0AAW1VHA9_9CUCU